MLVSLPSQFDKGAAKELEEEIFDGLEKFEGFSSLARASVNVDEELTKVWLDSSMVLLQFEGSFAEFHKAKFRFDAHTLEPIS